MHRRRGTGMPLPKCGNKNWIEWPIVTFSIIFDYRQQML
jgi:hypothetical protein